jgi:hypothetical protein
MISDMGASLLLGENGSVLVYGGGHAFGVFVGGGEDGVVGVLGDVIDEGEEDLVV